MDTITKLFKDHEFKYVHALLSPGRFEYKNVVFEDEGGYQTIMELNGNYYPSYHSADVADWREDYTEEELAALLDEQVKLADRAEMKDRYDTTVEAIDKLN